MTITVTPIAVSESANNDPALEKYNNLLADVTLTREIKSGSYNSICLPFAVSAASVTQIFGADCDIEELNETAVSNEMLTLNFVQRTAMEAGKPYLIQPKTTVTNPTFNNVRISNNAQTVTVGDVDFAGVFSPTTLAANTSILFLGAANTLSPSEGGKISGLRAYFVLKTEGSKKAAAKGIKSNYKMPTEPTDVTYIYSDNESPQAVKRLENGQLVIIRGGMKYNMQGICIGEEVAQ